jgi:hypothetical protein
MGRGIVDIQDDEVDHAARVGPVDEGRARGGRVVGKPNRCRATAERELPEVDEIDVETAVTAVAQRRVAPQVRIRAGHVAEHRHLLLRPHPAAIDLGDQRCSPLGVAGDMVVPDTDRGVRRIETPGVHRVIGTVGSRRVGSQHG